MNRWILSIGMVAALSAGVFAQSAPDPATGALQSCSDGVGGLLPQCAAAIPGVSPGRLPLVKTPAIRTVPERRPDRDTTPDREVAELQRLQPLPPEPVTEFQQFASTSVGRILPLFGTDFFERAPSTFAPVERIPVTADYVLGPGDEVLIRAWGQINLNLDGTVDRNGSIFVPQVGNVVIAGLPFSKLQGFLRSQFERVYRNFDLNVTMGQLRSIQIFVVGQARRPGVYTVSSLSTLVNALFACGGPSSQGSMRHIELKREGRRVAEFDVYSLLLEGDRAQDLRLMPGDVLHIRGIGPQVALAGSIRRPAIYELRAGQTLGELLTMAGGLTPVGDGHRILVERVTNGRRTTVEISADDGGLSRKLENGDIVHVPAVAPSFENTITLRGNVANPGRYAWRPGLRLRDIIPNKEALVTRRYWEQHNLVGYAPVKYTPATDDETQHPDRPAQQVAPLAPAINWSFAVIERRKPSDLSRQLVPFHLGRLVLDNDPGENRELQPGDIVTIFSQKDLQVPAAQQSMQVRLEGEFRSPGIYEVAPGETLGQLIQRAGGLTPGAYLYGAEFTRESARRVQQERIDQYARDLERDVFGATARNPSASASEEAAASNLRFDGLQKMVERLRSVKAKGRISLGFDGGESSLDQLANVALEDGDRMVVPPRPATVNILGAVYNVGSILHRRDWRIRDYLRMAGGGTRAADVSRTFLIRADGTVVSKQNFGHFGNSFEMAYVSPGDSIVVPEALPKSSLLRNLRDWTQLSSQLALSAAAVNVLR